MLVRARSPRPGERQPAAQKRPQHPQSQQNKMVTQGVRAAAIKPPSQPPGRAIAPHQLLTTQCSTATAVSPLFSSGTAPPSFLLPSRLQMEEFHHADAVAFCAAKGLQVRHGAAKGLQSAATPHKI